MDPVKMVITAAEYLCDSSKPAYCKVAVGATASVAVCSSLAIVLLRVNALLGNPIGVMTC